jgi:hypothetical protein
MSKASTRTPQLHGQHHPADVHVHLPEVSPATGEHDGGVGGQVGRSQQVHRHRGGAALVGQLQHLTLEIHTEAGAGEHVLLELMGLCDTLVFVGKGGELRPSVGQRGLLM